MCTERKQTRITTSLLDRFVAVCRHSDHTTPAVRFWRAGGVSLVVAGMMGMAGELTAPRAPALAALLSGSINLADVGGTVAGATFNGIANYDHAGISLSTAGDINGDGRADLLIGADFADADGTDRGQSYLVYGQYGSVVVGNGDYNDNGVVDAADYTVWQDNLGGDSAVLNGNGSGSSTVVQSDYDLWKQNFGNSETVSGQALPEPSSLLLGLVLAVATGLQPRIRVLE